MSTDEDIKWSNDCILLAGTLSAKEAIEQLEDSTARWVVIGDVSSGELAACETDEALIQLTQLTEEQLTGLTLASALELNEDSRAAIAANRLTLPKVSQRFHLLASLAPYIVIESDNRLAVGGVHVKRASGDRGAGHGAPVSTSDGEESLPSDTPSDGQDDDEGNKPVRYPDIEVVGQPMPGDYIEVIVDARLTPSDRTEGGALNIKPLDDDWRQMELNAFVSCSHIEFERDGEGLVTVFRNQPSVAAEFRGRLSEDVAVGQTINIDVAFFCLGRFCGAAQRQVVIGDDRKTKTASARGLLAVEAHAESPDVTVYISRDSEVTSNRLHWRVVTRRFDGLPPKLDGSITLGMDPEATATRLFESYARLKAGEHVRAIHAFGTQLWELAPPFFKQVYWALEERYKRTLTIQFVTDDPYLPWELMRPAKEPVQNAEDIHQPLALRHRTARWLRSWDGIMPASIEAGSLYTIAPQYPSVSARLPRALAESKGLVEEYQARSIKGDRVNVLRLLEDQMTEDAVSMVHFAGHGVFDAVAASESALKLEDGSLTASEVGMPEVTLGKRCRTVVFLNACEVGASGDVLGQVGGWADVLLKKHFGGFIAPLWAVEDQDASVVASELVEGVLVKREPIAEVLRLIRQTHGDVAPTFYSYLYYGDVCARVG